MSDQKCKKRNKITDINFHNIQEILTRYVVHYPDCAYIRMAIGNYDTRLFLHSCHAYFFRSFRHQVFATKPEAHFQSLTLNFHNIQEILTRYVVHYPDCAYIRMAIGNYDTRLFLHSCHAYFFRSFQHQVFATKPEALFQPLTMNL